MKRFITAAGGALLLAMSVLPTSCITIPEDMDSKDIEQKISDIQARAFENIHDALDQPLVVVSQTGDTIVAYMPDSVSEGAAVRNITVRVDEKDHIDPAVAKAQQRSLMAISIVVIPCATILLIAFAVLFFIFVRNRNRNAIISQAIEKGYELPESFFSGQNTTRIIYQNGPMPDPNSTNSQTNEPNDRTYNPASGTTAPTNLPPIPPVPPVDDKNLQSGIKLSVVGLCILIFFLVIGITHVAILAGGIPLLLGLGRLGSWYYLNNRH